MSAFDEFNRKATELLEFYCQAHSGDYHPPDYFVATVIPDGLTAANVRLDAIPLWRNAAQAEGRLPVADPHTIKVEPFTSPDGVTMSVLTVVGATEPTEPA